MEIQKIFSETTTGEVLYSVLMSEEEMDRLYTEITPRNEQRNLKYQMKRAFLGYGNDKEKEAYKKMGRLERAKWNAKNEFIYG